MADFHRDGHKCDLYRHQMRWNNQLLLVILILMEICLLMLSVMIGLKLASILCLYCALAL